VAVPEPLAADATVVSHRDEPTLIVKPAPGSGYAALLWPEGHQALMEDEEAGRYGALSVWAHGAGRREIARGHPAAGGSLRFKFRPGDPNYRKLVREPGPSAIVTVDRKTSSILGVKFRSRP
jgi:hypothetical protein